MTFPVLIILFILFYFIATTLYRFSITLSFFSPERKLLHPFETCQRQYFPCFSCIFFLFLFFPDILTISFSFPICFVTFSHIFSYVQFLHYLSTYFFLSYFSFISFIFGVFMGKFLLSFITFSFIFQFALFITFFPFSFS